MKRIILLCLVVCMCICMCACNNAHEPKENINREPKTDPTLATGAAEAVERDEAFQILRDYVRENGEYNKNSDAYVITQTHVSNAAYYLIAGKSNDYLTYCYAASAPDYGFELQFVIDVKVSPQVGALQYMLEYTEADGYSTKSAKVSGFLNAVDWSILTCTEHATYNCSESEYKKVVNDELKNSQAFLIKLLNDANLEIEFEDLLNK